MSMRKLFKSLMKGLEYFATSAGAVSLAVTIIGLVIIVNPFVALAVTGGMGLLAGCIGAAIKYKSLHASRESNKKDKILMGITELKNELDEVKEEVSQIENQMDNAASKGEERCKGESVPKINMSNTVAIYSGLCTIPAGVDLNKMFRVNFSQTSNQVIELRPMTPKLPVIMRADEAKNDAVLPTLSVAGLR